MKLKLNKGFTVIELLVAVTIIAILTSIAVLSYTSALKKSRDGKRKSDLENIRGALEMRHVDFGSYPDAIPAIDTTWTDTDANGVNYTYMQKVPKDPKNPTYTYSYTSNGTTYELCAYLESGGTDTCTGSCGSACNYKVTQP